MTVPMETSPTIDRDALATTLRERILTSADVKRQLADQLDDAVAVAALLVRAIVSGHKLLLFGNGGSAADAQHISAELIGHYYLDRRSLPALALTVDTSALTAIGNDYAFDLVFARQLDALGQPGDVAIGLSTSGNSRNVVEALRVAKGKGLVTVAMTGANGGAAAEVADICVRVPSTDTPRIQESHILLGHIWAEIIEAAVVAAER
ncbi:MAG: D-sedoheptulose 7-phosphate isomerase [Chloroflexota bacterium]